MKDSIEDIEEKVSGFRRVVNATRKLQPKTFVEEICEGLRTKPRDTVIELILLALFGAPLLFVAALFFYWTLCNLLIVIGVTDGCWLASYRY
jgi:hypothetical protein